MYNYYYYYYYVKYYQLLYDTCKCTVLNKFYLSISTPALDPVQPGVVVHELPPTETVKTSMRGFDTSTAFVATPAIVGGERIPQVKKLPTFDLSESSELLPSFGLSSSSSSSSSPTLHGGRLVAFVFAQPCAGGSVSEHSERRQFV